MRRDVGSRKGLRCRDHGSPERLRYRSMLWLALLVTAVAQPFTAAVIVAQVPV